MQGSHETSDSLASSLAHPAPVGTLSLSLLIVNPCPSSAPACGGRNKTSATNWGKLLPGGFDCDCAILQNTFGLTLQGSFLLQSALIGRRDTGGPWPPTLTRLHQERIPVGSGLSSRLSFKGKWRIFYGVVDSLIQ